MPHNALAELRKGQVENRELIRALIEKVDTACKNLQAKAANDPDATIRPYQKVQPDPDQTMSPLDKMHAQARLANAVNRLNTAVARIDQIRGSAKAWHAAANALHQIADILYDVKPPKLSFLDSETGEPEADH